MIGLHLDEDIVIDKEHASRRVDTEGGGEAVADVDEGNQRGGGERDPYYDDRKRSAREEYIKGGSSRAEAWVRLNCHFQKYIHYIHFSV